jgi:4-hydroxy-tetrahydrodipicolinate synthase
MEGIISVAANSFPKFFSEMVRYCLKSDFKSARTLNDKLMEGYELLFAENNPAGVKAALVELGLIGNYLRLPVVPVSKGLQEKIKKFVASL